MSGPVTREEAHELLRLVRRVEENTPLASPAWQWVEKFNGVVLYHLAKALEGGPAEDTHSRKVTPLRVVADSEDRSVRGRTL